MLSREYVLFYNKFYYNLRKMEISEEDVARIQEKIEKLK